MHCINPSMPPFWKLRRIKNHSVCSGLTFTRLNHRDVFDLGINHLLFTLSFSLGLFKPCHELCLVYIEDRHNTHRVYSPVCTLSLTVTKSN